MDRFNNVIRKNILNIQVIKGIPLRREKRQQNVTPLPARDYLYFAISFDNFAKYLSEIQYNIDCHIPIECVIYDEGIISCDNDVLLRLSFLKSIKNLNFRKIEFNLSESTFPLYNKIMDRINWKHNNVSYLKMTVDRYPTEIKDLCLEKAKGKIILPEEILLWQSDYVLNQLGSKVESKVLKDTDNLKYVIRHYVDSLERKYDFDRLTDFDKVWLTYHFINDPDKLDIEFAREMTFYGKDGLQHLRPSEEHWESKPYGTYIRRRGVCEGQARLFRTLLNNWDMKVDAVTINGSCPIGPHVWLGVVINDKLYYCCTTQFKLFDETNFVPYSKEYYPQVYSIASLSPVEKMNIERHIRTLKK